jgi:hypothetical protein
MALNFGLNASTRKTGKAYGKEQGKVTVRELIYQIMSLPVGLSTGVTVREADKRNCFIISDVTVHRSLLEMQHFKCIGHETIYEL